MDQIERDAIRSALHTMVRERAAEIEVEDHRVYCAAGVFALQLATGNPCYPYVRRAGLRLGAAVQQLTDAVEARRAQVRTLRLAS